MTPISPRKPKVEHQARVVHVVVYVSRVRYGLDHRRRINTEEKAKGLAAVWGQNLLNSLPL